VVFTAKGAIVRTNRSSCDFAVDGSPTIKICTTWHQVSG